MQHFLLNMHIYMHSKIQKYANNMQKNVLFKNTKFKKKIKNIVLSKYF